MIIALISASYSGNKGAATMLESAIQNVGRRPEVKEILVFSVFPRRDRELKTANGQLKILSASPLDLVFKQVPSAVIYRIGKWFGRCWILGEEVKALDRTDVVIDLAGISFSDGREFFLAYNVFSLLPPMIMAKKIIKAPQALGSFNGLANRLLAKFFLKRLDTVVARGKQSYEYAQRIGLKNVVLGADLGFAYEPKKNGGLHEKYLGKNANKIVGISLSAVVYEYCLKTNIDYIAIFRRLMEDCLASGYRILIIPHSMDQRDRAGEKPTDGLLDIMTKPRSDLRLCRTLFESLDSPDAILVKDELTASDLRQLIGGCDFYIASRFHAMISALAEVVPVMVCGWGHKYEEVLMDFRLGKYCLSYQRLTFEKLLTMFKSLEADAGLIKNQINSALPEVKKRSKSFLAYI